MTALADDTRRSIFEIVQDGPRSVREITDLVSVSQPAVSQHLRILREAGLVEARAKGTRNIYSVSQRGLEPLREWVETVWEDVLDAFERAAEKKGRSE